MAQIEPRTLGSGAKRYRVKWRLGGHRTGQWQYETFTDRNSAVSFKLAVEAAGHEWPEGWVRGDGWHPDYRPGLGWTEPDPEPEPEAVRFREYALDLIESLSGIDERTRADYRRDVNRHMLPAFGGLDIRDAKALSATTVRAWVNQLQAGIPDPRTPVNPNAPTSGRKGAKRGERAGWLRAPLRPKTIQNLHGLLFIILESAVQADPPLRASNPAARTRLPRIDDGEDSDDMCFLTREEFELLRDRIQEDVRDMLEVFVLTGLRYSELAALQVRDITLTKRANHLQVRRAWKRRSDHTFTLGAPKTKQSRRRVRLSKRTVQLLRPRLDGKAPTDFVFTTANGYWWRHSSFYTRRWAPAVRKARESGLHKAPRIHDLRHTHVSWLIEENVHPFKIQKRLGHKSITTTMDRYGHLVTDIDDDTLNALDGRPTPPPPALHAVPTNANTPTTSRRLALATP